MTQKKQDKNTNQNPQTNDSSNQFSEVQNQLLRVQADYENFRKRSINDRENYIKQANADIILSLLPVLDNFKRAANHVPQTEDATIKNWITGVQAVEKQLEMALMQYNVQEIDATPGQTFDPAIHEAISHEPSDQPVDTIAKVTESGYKLNDKILRPAKVIVSAGK